jgi:hypothetical protein
MGCTLYLGPLWIHLSLEDGLEWERPPHRTWRLGIVLAVRARAR